MSLKLFILLFPLLLGAGCAVTVPERPVIREEFDPLSLDDDDVLAELRQALRAKKDTAVVPSEGPALPDTSEEVEYVQGYRVQIFASTDPQAAKRMKEEAGGIFKEGVYVEFEAPYYKVRIGDCLTPVEAEALLRKVQREGYRGSFVVRTAVKVSGKSQVLPER